MDETKAISSIFDKVKSLDSRDIPSLTYVNKVDKENLPKNEHRMNETKAVLSEFDKLKSVDEQEISSLTYVDKENKENLYKNSDMFTLISNKSAYNHISVTFQLLSKVEIPRHSWLYEIKKKCGTLDPNRDWVWNTTGCQMTNSFCTCTHLSHFAMLISIRRINQSHLMAFQILSLIGGCINVVSTALFIAFVLIINGREKRRDDLLNIAFCMMVGTIMFFGGSLFSAHSRVCSLAAIAAQFFFLTAFMWKLILGINVIQSLTLVEQGNEQSMVKYPWLMYAISYTVPMAIAVTSGVIYREDYGHVAQHICWIDSSSTAFLSFLLPVGLILAINTVVIGIAAIILIRKYRNSVVINVNISHEIYVFIQLFVSMGLTWLPAYFIITYLSAMYLFITLFPLQGLLMFLLVIVLAKQNRDHVSLYWHTNYSSRVSQIVTSTEDQIHPFLLSESLCDTMERSTLIRTGRWFNRQRSDQSVTKRKEILSDTSNC